MNPQTGLASAVSCQPLVMKAWHRVPQFLELLSAKPVRYLLLKDHILVFLNSPGLESHRLCGRMERDGLMDGCKDERCSVFSGGSTCGSMLLQDRMAGKPII